MSDPQNSDAAKDKLEALREEVELRRQLKELMDEEGTSAPIKTTAKLDIKSALPKFDFKKNKVLIIVLAVVVIIVIAVAAFLSNQPSAPTEKLASSSEKNADQPKSVFGSQRPEQDKFVKNVASLKEIPAPLAYCLYPVITDADPYGTHADIKFFYEDTTELSAIIAADSNTNGDTKCEYVDAASDESESGLTFFLYHIAFDPEFGWGGATDSETTSGPQKAVFGIANGNLKDGGQDRIDDFGQNTSFDFPNQKAEEMLDAYNASK